jgi:peptidoglycan/LPS O-acetylase OafA/YrhL
VEDNARRTHLDGVRGVAILLVLLAHVFPDQLTVAGPLGVLVFFVLSGYLITSRLVAEHERAGGVDLPKFYLRRALRLLPALVVVLALYLTVLAVVPGTGTSLSLGVGGLLLGLFYAVDFANAFAWPVPHELAHLWTLSVEEQFYVVWPLIALLLLGRFGLPRFRACSRVLFPVVVVLSLTYPWLMVWTGSRVDLYFLPCAWVVSLFAGAHLALLPRCGPRRPPRPGGRLGSAAAAPACLVLLGLTAVAGQWEFRPFWTLTAIPVTSVCVMVLIDRLERGQGTDLLSIRPLVVVGRISYGLYLLHLPVILLAGRVWGGGTLGRCLAALAAALLAVALHRLVESPALRLKARVGRPRGSVPASADQQAVAGTGSPAAPEVVAPATVPA